MGITQCNSIEFTEKKPGAAAIIIQDLYKISNNLTFPVQRQRLLATLEHVLQ